MLVHQRVNLLKSLDFHGNVGYVELPEGAYD